MLDGAWRMVVRSLPPLQPGLRMVSAGTREERGLQSGAKKLESQRNDWSTRLVLEEVRVEINCAELILWTSQTGD
jgi:hypothetical protein